MAARGPRERMQGGAVRWAAAVGKSRVEWSRGAQRRAHTRGAVRGYAAELPACVYKTASHLRVRGGGVSFREMSEGCYQAVASSFFGSSADTSSSLRWGILPVVKYCSISSRVRPLVSGMMQAVMK